MDRLIFPIFLRILKEKRKRKPAMNSTGKPQRKRKIWNLERRKSRDKIFEYSVTKRF